MSVEFTWLLGMVVLFIGGALVVRILVRLKAKKTMETLYNILPASYFLYVGLAGYYAFLDEGFGGALGAVMLSGLIGFLMLAYQPMEAVLLLLHINEPTAWPNIFIEGPSAHFTR